MAAPRHPDPPSAGEHRVPVGRDRFELRRRSDGLVYRFARAERADGVIGYRREGADVWIVRDARFGWITVLGKRDEVVNGLPWGVLPADQGDFPPDGDWVGRKGDKSYVYTLVYVDEAGREGALPDLVSDT